MLDKTKRYLVVGLGLLGGKYALELTKAGFHVDGINRSEGHLQYALEHGYIASGKTHDFEDLVSSADHIIFGLYPTALIEWFRTYGHLLKPGCIFTDVSGVKTGLVEPVQAMCPAGVEFIARGHSVGKGPGRSAGLPPHLHPDGAGARQDDRLCEPAVPCHRREPDVRQR